MKAFVMDKWDRYLVEGIIDIYEEFLDETSFPITKSREKAYDRLNEAFFHPNCAIVYLMDEYGNFGGGAVLCAVDDWQKEKFGYMEKFFIRSQCRSKGISRMLAKKCAEWFDEQNCLFSFATSTANIGSSGLFTNLMAKFEYTELGPTLMRKKPNGKIQSA